MALKPVQNVHQPYPGGKTMAMINVYTASSKPQPSGTLHPVPTFPPKCMIIPVQVPATAAASHAPFQQLTGPSSTYIVREIEPGCTTNGTFSYIQWYK